MKSKRFALLLLSFILTAALLLPTVSADGGEPVLISDSDNEAMDEFSADETLLPPLTQLGAGTPAPVYGSGHFSIAAEFVEDAEKSAYIDRMIDYYIAQNADLQTALANDYSVIFFFEGGSDIGLIEENGTRTGALSLVVHSKADAPEEHEILYYNKNSDTIPDYPFAYAYDNGHDGYGMAILLDGVYNITTVQHKSIYAGFKTRSGSAVCVPCLYMKEDGTFSVLNGSGIHIHTRLATTVSGGRDHPLLRGLPVRGRRRTL